MHICVGYIMIVRMPTYLVWFALYIVCEGLTDITTDVFDKENFGIVAAFGDFNSDKLVDIFRIVNNGKAVDILFGHESKPFLRKLSIRCETNHSNIITSVMPSDYDGDSMMDILITVAEADNKNYINTVHILWGNREKVNCNSDTHFRMKGQPLVMDYNGDMIPDLFGMDEKNRRSVWMFDRNRNLTTHNLTDEILHLTNQHISLPHSCAFTDLNGDMVADLFITGEKSIEYWINNQGNFEYNRSLDYPKDISQRGQITFGDLNSDGVLEKILPVCKDETCINSSIMVWNQETSEWKTLFNDFQFENITWGFIPYDDKNVLENPAFPITLRMSDFNMDGYPDFLAVMQSKSPTVQSKALLLLNKPCSGCPFERTLNAEWDMAGLSDLSNVQIAAFYDIFENGIMDIIVASYNAEKWELHALQNTFTYDAYFIKVLVLSGLCYSDCPDDNVPYGANNPGSYIRYYTTKINGDTRRGSAVQLLQSAYFPLQLPYVVLGLGETPNFVDELFVTIPGFTNKKARSREWAQIIPNSQMVVIPNPPDNPERWINKLFVTPSRLVILTLSALVGTCAFICVIIGFLHWKEKRVDHLEKLQEAHRFHFDAM